MLIVPPNITFKDPRFKENSPNSVINLSLVTRLDSLESDRDIYIKFEFVKGHFAFWNFETKEQRDKTYQEILNMSKAIRIDL